MTMTTMHVFDYRRMTDWELEGYQQLPAGAARHYSNDKPTQFRRLCRDGQTRWAEALLRRHPKLLDINTGSEEDPRPPLIVATDMLRYEIISFLLAYSARDDVVDDKGRTAMHLLCRMSCWLEIPTDEQFRHHISAVQQLSRIRGYCRDDIDNEGKSAAFHLFDFHLMSAEMLPINPKYYINRIKRMRRRQCSLMHQLLYTGSRPSVVTPEGKSLLHCVADWPGPIASYHRNDIYGAHMAQLLCQYGADLDARWTYQSCQVTALELAVKNLNYAVAKVLVYFGADVTEFLDYEKYFPIGSTDVINTDTIIRTYFMSEYMFEKLERPRIVKMLEFLERPPTVKNVDGLNALIKWGTEDKIRDYFDDVWLALEDEQLPRAKDTIKWKKLKRPVERAYTIMTLGQFDLSQETIELYEYMYEILPGGLDIMTVIRIEVENELTKAQEVKLTDNLTLLELCRMDPNIIHEPEVYEALREVLDDDFESKFPQTREMFKGRIARNLIRKLHVELDALPSNET